MSFRERVIVWVAGLAVASGAGAAEGRWSLDVAFVELGLGGHDREVLVDREDTGAGTTVSLESESALGYRAELGYAGGGRWSYGLDFQTHRTDQDAARRTGAAAPGGLRTFVVGGGEVVSRGPGEPLYFERLEDTTVELWTAGVLAARELWSGPNGELRLLVGLEIADFDNDYRAIAGIEDTGGLRLDASSNYDRMHGPLVGLAGAFERGRNRFDFALRQAVVFGDVELSSSVREFTGPPVREVDAELPNVVVTDRFTATASVEIPITELRLAWRFALTEHLAAGLGAYASLWSDVAVPPGVVAGSELSTRDESTIETYGLSAGLGVRF